MDRLSRYLLPTLFIFGVALLRLLPHPPNLVPMTAICLFAGAQFRSQVWRYAVPVSAILLTDILQSTNSTFIAMFVYAGYLLNIAVGKLLRMDNQLVKLLPASIFGSLIFYVTSNFGFWCFTGIYSHTFSGLVTCYIKAIPFLLNSIVADAFYVLAVFGGFSLLQHGIHRTAKRFLSSFYGNNVQL